MHHRSFGSRELPNQKIKEDLTYISFNIQIKWWIEPDSVSLSFSSINIIVISFSLLEILMLKYISSFSSLNISSFEAFYDSLHCTSDICLITLDGWTDAVFTYFKFVLGFMNGEIVPIPNSTQYLKISAPFY